MLAALLLAVVCITGCENRLQEIIARDMEPALPGLPPGAPSDLAATVVSVSQIDLSWTDNSENETEFQIQRKKTSSEDWQTESIGQDSTTYSDKELDPDTEYIYRVRAANAEGQSEWTIEISAKTLAIITYSVTYDGNGAESGRAPVDSTEYREGERVTVKDFGTLALSGSTFTNWDTKSNGGGTDYVIGSAFPMPAADVVLYAEWTSNPTYTVIYHGHGADSGEVPVDPNNYEQGDFVTVSGPNTLNLTGYDFVEWNTQEDNSGIPRNPGDEFTMGAEDVDLWAQWTEASYTLSYNGNGSDGGTVPSDGVYDFNEVVTVAVQGSMTREGYTFDGWERDDGSYPLYNGGDTFPMPGNNVTLYAQWSINSYTITYHANEAWGGSVPSPQIANYNTQLTVRANTGDLHQTATPAWMGEDWESYKFVGWNTRDDGFGTQYEAGIDSITVTDNITLFAEWGEYEVGDRGPAGGWIFYKKTSFIDGWRYLEAAARSEEEVLAWGVVGVDINGDDASVAPELTGIGYGEINTKLIESEGDEYRAVFHCCEVALDGYGFAFDDWFLPTRDEVFAMYNNLHNRPTPLGRFRADGYYWSSSEFNDDHAIKVGFTSGSEYYDNKNSENMVRPVRAF